MRTGNVPIGVLVDVVTFNTTVIGFPAARATVVDGWNWQPAPCGNPEQASVTKPLNDPRVASPREIGGLLAPGATLTDAGEGAAKLKSTMCSVRAKSCVTARGSLPTACRLKM